VPTRIHTQPDLLDELAALGFDLVDALRQGPILGATLLLLALLAMLSSFLASALLARGSTRSANSAPAPT